MNLNTNSLNIDAFAFCKYNSEFKLSDNTIRNWKRESMGKKAINFDGLKYISITIWLEVTYILINGVTGLFSLLQIAAMAEISQGLLLFSSKIVPDLLVLIFVANTALYIIGLNKLHKLNPYYRNAFRAYIIYLAFLLLAIIAFTVFFVTASGFAVLAINTENINTTTVSVLIWVLLVAILAVQVIGNILNIIYMRNILFGTRRIVDVLGGKAISQGINITEKVYRIAMIVATVIEVIGATGILFVIKKYIHKIIGEGAEAFVALYSAFRGMQTFLFLLTAAYIISFVVRTIFAIRLTKTYLELSKHELSDEEEAMLLEDSQAVYEAL